MEMDSMCIDCLLKKQYKDTIIISQSRQINSLEIQKDNFNKINDSQSQEIIVLSEQNNKLTRKKSRNLKLGALFGLILGLTTQLIF